MGPASARPCELNVESTRDTKLRSDTPGGGILRRASRNLAYLAGGKSVSGVLSLIYLALAVRSLGVDAYGQLILIYAFAQLISAIVQFQTWQPILHFGTPALAESRFGDFRRVVRFSLGLDAASAAVGMLLVGGGIWLLGPHIDLPEEVLPLASGFGLAVPFIIVASPNGLLRLFDRFDLLLLEDNVEAVVRLIGAFGIFLFGGGLTAFVVVWAISVIASGGTCAILAWREIRRRGVWRDNAIPTAPLPIGKQFPGIWGFVWSTNLNSTLKLTRTHIATIVIGGAIDATEAGLFRIAQQIAEALAKPLKLMIPVIYPELARLAAARDFTVLRQFNRRTLGYSSLGAIGGFCLLAAIGPIILDIIGGDEADGAYTVMLMLSAAALIRLSAFCLEPTLISLGHPSIALGIQSIATAVYLPLLFVMLPWLGFNGAGVASITIAVLTVVLQFAAVAFWFPSTPASCSHSVEGVTP
jgi:O-antigen/teichoic acid export membrane protein